MTGAGTAPEQAHELGARFGCYVPGHPAEALARNR